ncbi:MAG: hypothetical protein GXP35_05930, partial [Actinobacteria bacterium]|nr:hypothetical protein [Actinomycetota bacterium]
MRTRRVTRIVLVTASVVLAVLGIGPIAVGVGGAAADLANDPSSDLMESDAFVLDAVGPGRCLPTTAVTGSLVECRFPLIGRVQLPLDWQGPVTAVVSPGINFDTSPLPVCVFELGELRCSRISAPFQPGDVEVSLDLDGQTRTLAQFVVVESFDYDYFVLAESGPEPVAFEGRPVRLSTWRNVEFSEQSLWANVLRRVEGPERFADPLEYVSTQRMTVPQLNTFDSVTNEVEPPTEPGRYVILMCVGESEETCSVIPNHISFQVIDPKLVEIVPGHNRAEAERINLVFAGSGFPDGVKVVDVARELLTTDGAVLDRYEGGGINVVDDNGATEGSLVADIVFGPFAIEPMASNMAKFNLWAIPDQIEDERAFFHNADPEFSTGNDLDGFILGHVSIVNLHHQALGRYERSEAWWTGFRGATEVPELDDLDFAGIYLAIDALQPLTAARTLAHEMGHALFDLRDEYFEVGRGTEYGFPNCALGDEEATNWWGDQVGEIDPFVDEYMAVLDRYDWFYPDDIVQQLTVGEVGSVTGGCYDGGTATMRPTPDSLMNSEVPVFGAVNRLRVSQVLDQFNPRVPLTQAADAVLRCFPAAQIEASESVLCGGQLTRWVDQPSGQLEIAVGDTVVRCRIDTIDVGDVRGV